MSKKACRKEAKRIISEGLITGMSEMQLAREIYSHALAFYFCEKTGLFPEIPLMEDYEFSLRMKQCKGAKGPGLTKKWLITSARRYGTGTGSILKTELCMWKLRRMYRSGTDAVLLNSMYDDIR